QPDTRGRPDVENGPDGRWPLPEVDRADVAVYSERRIVEWRRARGRGDLAARDVGEQEVRGAHRDRGDGERKLHGGAMVAEPNIPSSARGPRLSSASRSCRATGCGSPS